MAHSDFLLESPEHWQRERSTLRIEPEFSRTTHAQDDRWSEPVGSCGKHREGVRE